jgi:hypothetical protein
MEYLLMFEPIAKVLFAAGVVLAILSTLGIVASWVFNLATLEEMKNNGSYKKEENEKLLAEGRTIHKYAVRWFIPTLIITALVSPLSEPFDIYKKVLIVRGIESETADKLVDNVNALLDFTEQKIRKASIEDVKEIVKEELKKEVEGNK